MPGRTLAAVLAALVLASCSGCTTARYLGQAVRGELQILLNRRPLSAALDDPTTPPERRAQLRLIARTARAAQQQLGLRRDDQYSEVAELDDDFRVWVLVAAEPDALTTVTWRFPIAGEVPYLGFFAQEDAWAMAREHYPDKDHYVRTAAAFSTLGYLPEPVLPGFFAMPDAAIVATVVHELVHATVYVPGDTAWNETIATALGQAGAMRLAQQWGQPQWIAELERRAADYARWATIVDETVAALGASYAAATGPTDIAARKAAGMAVLAERIRAAPWHNEGYRRLADGPLNHAFLLAQQAYAQHPALQDAWRQAALHDFRRAVAELQRRVQRGEGLWDPVPAALLPPGD